MTLQDVGTILRMATCAYFVHVWLWHTSPEAAQMKGANEYGWFFRYLTFCSFTLQTVQLFSASLLDLTKEGTNLQLRRVVDDLSCLTFSTANAVTIMYYTIEAMTNNVNESPSDCAFMWVDNVVHFGNCVVAWVDMLTGRPRSFSPRAQNWTIIFALSYAVWILIVKSAGGRYPYPFLETLPFPGGFLMVAIFGASLQLTAFRLGRFLCRRITVLVGKSKDCGDVEVRGEFKVD